jgi:Glycosyl transferase family 2
MDRSTEADVTLAIASLNTQWATELCLRSLRACDAGAPFRVVVGDCGSTDGSLPMLTRSLKSGIIDELEVAPRGRFHQQWADHWVTTTQTPYLVMLDSDVEIRADGWLKEMLERLNGAGACAASVDSENPNFRSPWDGTPLRLGRRFSMHCALFNVAAVRATGRSFAARDVDPEDGGRTIRYDVGGWLGAGLELAVMPDGWEQSHIVHYRAMSWAMEAQNPRLRRHWFRSQATIAVRLVSYRVGGRRAAQTLTYAHTAISDVRRRAARLRT